jgi:hypothetical protein
MFFAPLPSALMNRSNSPNPASTYPTIDRSPVIQRASTFVAGLGIVTDGVSHLQSRHSTGVKQVPLPKELLLQEPKICKKAGILRIYLYSSSLLACDSFFFSLIIWIFRTSELELDYHRYLSYSATPPFFTS